MTWLSLFFLLCFFLYRLDVGVIENSKVPQMTKGWTADDSITKGFNGPWSFEVQRFF